MLCNLFNNVNVSNKMFMLKDTKLFEVLEEENSNLESFTKDAQERINESLEKIKGKKIIIKAFSFQPNLNGYEIILNERKEDLKVGFEKIKNLCEFKLVASKEDKKLVNSLKEFNDVIAVKSIEELNSKKLFKKIFGSDEDVLIIDIVDVIRIGQASEGKAIENFVTVYGSAVKEKRVLVLKKEATYKEIFEAVNGGFESLVKIVDGGSLNGKQVYDINNKISSESRGILFLSNEDLPSNEVYSCINCSKCLRVCPEGLNPIKLYDLYKRNEKEEFIKFGGDKCIDCGLCSYVCPSNIEIAQAIKTAKTFK
ncbi:4Fe-4S dicluster domain-containing protein [Clostridium tertium]|uniref:Electron transport complex protein RnfC n=1 Tax=Clostridium tertium TaxID=1559 RepID=A0A6N3CE51_9CLOT